MSGAVIQVGVWELLSAAGGIVMAMIGVQLTLSRAAARALDERLKLWHKQHLQDKDHIQKQIESLRATDAERKREMESLRLRMSERYVRREDYVRQDVTLNAKLDAMSGKIERLTIEIGRLRGGK